MIKLSDFKKKKHNNRSLSEKFTKLIFVLAVAVSFSHTKDRYDQVGFHEPIIDPFLWGLIDPGGFSTFLSGITGSLLSAIVAELAFSVALFALYETYRTTGGPPTWENDKESILLFSGGLLMVLWSNISAAVGIEFAPGTILKIIESVFLGASIPYFVFGSIMTNFKKHPAERLKKESTDQADQSTNKSTSESTTKNTQSTKSTNQSQLVENRPTESTKLTRENQPVDKEEISNQPVDQIDQQNRPNQPEESTNEQINQPTKSTTNKVDQLGIDQQEKDRLVESTKNQPTIDQTSKRADSSQLVEEESTKSTDQKESQPVESTKTNQPKESTNQIDQSTNRLKQPTKSTNQIDQQNQPVDIKSTKSTDQPEVKNIQSTNQTTKSTKKVNQPTKSTNQKPQLVKVVDMNEKFLLQRLKDEFDNSRDPELMLDAAKAALKYMKEHGKLPSKNKLVQLSGHTQHRCYNALNAIKKVMEERKQQAM